MNDTHTNISLSLLADCGSTKVDWCLTQDGNPVLRVQTAGINPVYQSEEEMECCIQNELLPALGGQVPQSLHFYGAGCATPALTEKVSDVLQRCICPEGRVEVCSDMVGAALGACAMTIIGIYAQAHNVDVSGMKMEVTKTMNADPRRIGKLEVTFIMPQRAYSDKEKASIERAARTCPVHLSLHPDTEQVFTFVWQE